MLVVLPEGSSEPAASRAAAAAGVWVEGLSSHQVLGRDQVGFILGYANVSEPAIERGLALLAAALTSSQPSSVSARGTIAAKATIMNANRLTTPTA